MNKKDITNFQDIVWDFYKKNKRDLPWRPKRGHIVSPYQILVSEFMLQQTQVDRVVPKFLAFIERFSDMQSLEKASVKDVLRMWSGLGYNRRALYLKESVKLILSEYQTIIPKESSLLKTLPGVGAYMSKILPVFIYNKKETLIETNIRTVYLYHFFKNKESVSDKEIIKIIEDTLPNKYFCEWYYALMDYGSYLKKEKKIKNTQSASYIKQKPFKSSLRYVRGQILKRLLVKKIKKEEVYDLFPEYTSKQVETVCNSLLKESLMQENRNYFFL